MTVQTDPDALRSYADNMQNLQSAIEAINEYVHTYGCDKSGFTGLFMLLRPAVDLVEKLFDETLKFGKEKLGSLERGVQEAAQHYADNEVSVTGVLKELSRAIDETGSPA